MEKGMTMKVINIKEMFKDIFISVGMRGVFLEDTRAISIDNITPLRINKNTEFFIEDIDIIQHELGIQYLKDNKVAHAIVSFKYILTNAVVNQEFTKKIDTVDLSVLHKDIIDFKTLLMIFIPLLAFLVGVAL